MTGLGCTILGKRPYTIQSPRNKHDKREQLIGLRLALMKAWNINTIKIYPGDNDMNK